MIIKQELVLLEKFEETEKMGCGTCGCHTNLYGKGTWQPVLKTDLSLYRGGQFPLCSIEDMLYFTLFSLIWYSEQEFMT